MYNIYNKSISTGIFPLRLKYSITKPLFKMGDKNNMAKRPASLLTSFSKLLEVLYKRILTDINNHKILANELFGFRSKSSTVQVFYNLIFKTLQAFNNKRIVGDIFLTQKKLMSVLNIIFYYQNYSDNPKTILFVHDPQEQ